MLGEKGTFLHCCWEYKLVQPVRKAVWKFFSLKLEIQFNIAISFLSIFQKVSKLSHHSEAFIPMCIAQVITAKA